MRFRFNLSPRYPVLFYARYPVLFYAKFRKKLLVPLEVLAVAEQPLPVIPPAVDVIDPAIFQYPRPPWHFNSHILSSSQHQPGTHGTGTVYAARYRSTRRSYHGKYLDWISAFVARPIQASPGLASRQPLKPSFLSCSKASRIKKYWFLFPGRCKS